MLGWGVLSAAAGATAVLLLQWWSRTACRPGRRGRKGYTSIDAARNPEVVGGVIADAYEGTMLATVRHDYCVAMSTSLSETLQELVQETQQLKMPQMLSSPLTVRLLQSLIRAGSATRALEIGTYTGFTAVGMAEAMPQDGLVLCLDDFSDEAAAEALCERSLERWAARRAQRGAGARVELRKQRAVEGLKQLATEGAAPFDLCFIDADKESQIAYVDLLSEGLISAGGCVVVDNTLWYSRVLRPRGRHDACTKAVVDFNQHVLKDGLQKTRRRSGVATAVVDGLPCDPEELYLEVTMPRDATPGRSQAVRASRTDGVAPRRCSDVGCGLCFLAFLAVTAQSCLMVVDRIDLQKLSRGIDHRGRLCGWSAGAEAQKLLHWCTFRAEHHLSLSSPICVADCPHKGSSVLCPEPNGLQITESEELREGGQVLLVRTEKQLLSPSQVGTTTSTWLDRYCVPELPELDSFPSSVSGAAAAQLLGFLERARQLASVPRALAVAGLWVLALNMAYLLCLRYCALFFVHATMLLALFLCLAGSVVFLALCSPAVLSGLSWLSLPASVINTFNVASAKLPAPLAAFLSLLLLLAAASLTGGLCARRRLDVASDCIRESCAVMLAMPSLLLLPLLDALLSHLLWALLLVTLAVLLSTAEVSELTLLGISGVFRQFHLAAVDYLRLICVVFSCFWIQELMGAACVFATAYSVATWYFAPGTSRSGKARHLPLAPAIEGLVIAFIWHLGSLARGACTLALLRLLRWALWLLHLALRQEDEPDQKRAKRCGRCFTVLCDALLATLQAWTEFLSSHAYVDIALSSQSYGVAAAKAAELLGSHGTLVSILALIAWFLHLAP
ncbi:unnamed protein product [Durusdinium trenchii]|uniref:Caffeoyl-CoA O-methyltransferase n=1 Tax=Durusdinium trenchii TaxID=1381693 RepID=A0ABP0J4R0_9DINO